MIRRLRLLVLLAALAALPAGAGMGITGANTPHVHSDANTGGGDITPESAQISGAGQVAPDGGGSTCLADPSPECSALFVRGTVSAMDTGAPPSQGDVHIKNDVGRASLFLDGPASGLASSIFVMGRDGIPRWAFDVRGTESGSASGSDLCIKSYGDAGGDWVSGALCLKRSSGVLYTARLCAAGYTRINPNLCMKTTVRAGFTALTRDVVATLTDPTSDSKALIVAYDVHVGTDNTGLEFCGTTNGTNSQLFVGGAGAAGQDFTGQAVIAKDTGYSLIFNDGAANDGSAGYEIRGYYD